MAELDYDTLELLRRDHPTWRLLRSDHAALVVSFLHRVFIRPNVRSMAEANLAEALEDDLFGLRERLGADAFPRPARDYLNDWASPQKGWLRKFYPHGSDEPEFDLLPATERVIGWLGGLEARAFVGTESRLLMLIELLRQIATGSQADPAARLAELERRRREVDAEIARARAGQLELLDDTAIRDRFQQFSQMARELLADFREVEHNFRRLDRSVRERIALWEGGKAALLEEILGRRDAIDESDQGRSFRAFWDFLMSDRRQQELTDLLDRVCGHPAVQASEPDPRLRRVHYDWLQAGDRTQRTVAELSRQLRRFLDDQAWLENRRIMDLLRGIEAQALRLRDTPPPGAAFAGIGATAAAVSLPFERPLFTPGFKPALAATVLEASGEALDASVLFAVRLVDKAALKEHIRHALRAAPQVTLGELVAMRPLEHALAEVIAYLELACGSFTITVDEAAEETIRWTATAGDGTPLTKSARLPRVIFVR